MGVGDGEVVAISGAAAEGAVALVEKLSGRDAEVVTLVVGAGVAEKDRHSVEESLRRSFPGLEIEVLDGDQPVFPFIIGVE